MKGGKKYGKGTEQKDKGHIREMGEKGTEERRETETRQENNRKKRKYE